ncbi:hypothetical protein CP533_1522 [Ophiocordyceps camponoti-saundersi (nom. inval.)]|nr:hypothetical protein CP533_1522 [Ophiocordyceps camponoti-saundersi (nom. inval.)]
MKSLSVLALAVGLVSAASVPPQLAERSLFMPSLKDFFRREDNKAQNGTESGQQRGNGQERGNGNNNRNGENNNNNNNNNNNENNNRNNGNNIQNLNGNDLNNLLQQSGQCQAFIQNGCNLGGNFNNGNQNFNNQNENNNENNNNRNNNNNNNNNNIQNLNSNDLNNLLQSNQQCQAFIQSGCNFNNNNLINGQNFNQQMIAVLAGNVHQLAVNLSPQIGQVVTVSAVGNLNLVQVMQLNNVLSFAPMMGQILVSQGIQPGNINSMLVQPIVSSINSNGINLNEIQGGIESIKSVNVVPV